MKKSEWNKLIKEQEQYCKKHNAQSLLAPHYFVTNALVDYSQMGNIVNVTCTIRLAEDKYVNFMSTHFIDNDFKGKGKSGLVISANHPNKL